MRTVPDWLTGFVRDHIPLEQGLRPDCPDRHPQTD